MNRRVSNEVKTVGLPRQAIPHREVAILAKRCITASDAFSRYTPLSPTDFIHPTLPRCSGNGNEAWLDLAFCYVAQTNSTRQP